MAIPNCRLHFVQWIIFAAESATFLHVRCADEPAIKPICPAVVSALDSPGKLSRSIRDQAGAPVAAHVVKRTDRLIIVTVDDDALTGNLTQEIVTGIRDLIVTP